MFNNQNDLELIFLNCSSTRKIRRSHTSQGRRIGRSKSLRQRDKIKDDAIAHLSDQLVVIKLFFICYDEQIKILK